MSTMNHNLTELIDVSRLYGKDKTFVIAGGGNTSFKDESHIWVKASGVALETIDESGFVCLSRAKLKIVSTKTYSQQSALREAEVKADLANAIVSEGNNRPSVETSMHEIIGYQFVVHTHPTKVNAVMCSNNAESVCRELFGDQSLFIPYTDPGYILFKKVVAEISLFTTKFGRAPHVIFLENHGVFVAANSIQEINDLYASIIERINQKIKEALPSDEQKQFSSPVIDKIQELHAGFVTFTAMGIESSLIHHFVKDHTSFQKANTAFTPDDIVYCKAHYLFIPAIANDLEQLESAKILINSYVDTYGYLPKVLVLEEHGVIAVEDSLKSVLNVLEVYSNILKISFLSENFGGPKFMTKSQIEFIDNWEVENYRRKMAKS
jgi:rhamnose utilization protein RhaD (predicted bifunctional aldolase and dehydrogenase)